MFSTFLKLTQRRRGAERVKRVLVKIYGIFCNYKLLIILADGEDDIYFYINDVLKMGKL